MQLIANNAYATLAGSITSGATSLMVDSAAADKFPVGTTTDWLTPLDWFKATIEDSSGNIEIVKVGTRAAASGVFSVMLRGQEGTTARAFAAGSIVELRITAADQQAGVNAVETSIQKTGGTMTGALELAGNAVDAMDAVPKQQLDASAAASAAALAAAIVALNSAIAAAAYVTGDMVDTFATTARAGFVLASGRTIGSAASTATERAHADTSALFTLLWNSMADAQAPVLPGGRGASAAADYAANKTIALPDLRGRVTAGKDNMGGADASRLSNIVGTTLGIVGGNQAHTLTVGQLPPHKHAQSSTGAPGAGNMTARIVGAVGSETFDNNETGQAGGNEAHNNIQPTFITNKIIKL